MAYMSEVVSSMLSMIFIIFAIATVGYLIGGISIKGISLGTAGVLLVALVYGVVASYIPEMNIGEHTINLFNEKKQKSFFVSFKYGNSDVCYSCRSYCRP